MAQPTRAPVLVLVTDGPPSAPVSSLAGCDPTIDDAALAASACATGDAEIPVYVVSVGVYESLDAIASAGTTGTTLTAATDVPAEIAAALSQIRE